MLYVWSLFVRVSHWLLVAAFATAWLTHASMWYANMHLLAGYITGILLLGRIAWGLCVKGYCNFNKFPFRPWEGLRYDWASLTRQARPCIGHNPAGSVVIYSILAVGLLTVLSGWLALNNAYLPDTLADFSSMQAVLAWTWLALVVTHVSGVIVESLLQRENLVASNGHRLQDAPSSFASLSLSTARFARVGCAC